MGPRSAPLGWITALLLAVAVGLLSAAAGPDETMAQEANAGGLPLGPANLAESRTFEEVVPGVTYTRIMRGERSKEDFYTVDVAFKADLGGAEELAQLLRADGYKPRIERVSERAPDDPENGPLGYLVRVGSFAQESKAVALATRLEADGYTGVRVVYTGEDGGETTGPWVVHVIEVDPTLYKGTLVPEIATKIVPERETLSSLSARTGALAAINGGYFVIDAKDGTPGDLAGISMLDGVLVSESVDGRTSLIIPRGSGEGTDVAAISDALSATASDGATRVVDGRNRKPGLIRGCGGDGGDVPTENPKHDFTCNDGSELIQFTPIFGTSTEPGAGVEAVLDSSGRVSALREGRGGQIPPGGSVLAGTGEAAGWLRDHARPGATIRVTASFSADGARLTGKTGVVNGGPRLLRGGGVDITANAEGFHWPENPEFYYRFGVRRNPRTLAGTTPGGDVLLVAVDGRRPGYSVGASFEESALLMQALGADEAVNLDGGGSTAVTVGEELVNRPSDTAGERPVGDAVVLLP